MPLKQTDFSRARFRTFVFLYVFCFPLASLHLYRTSWKSTQVPVTEEYPSLVMSNTRACAEQLTKVEHLSLLMLKIISDGVTSIEQFSDSPVLRGKYTDADTVFRSMFSACHGPIPAKHLHEVSALKWMSGLYACTHHGLEENGQTQGDFRPSFKSGFEHHFHGWWCSAGWFGLEIEPKFWHVLSDAESLDSENVSYAKTKMLRAISQTLWCAMHLEFPVHALPAFHMKKGTTKESRKITQNRVVLLALTLNSTHTSLAAEAAMMGCELAQTAIIQGWDTYFAVGEFTGLIGKFERALAALQIMSLN